MNLTSFDCAKELFEWITFINRAAIIFFLFKKKQKLISYCMYMWRWVNSQHANEIAAFVNSHPLIVWFMLSYNLNLSIDSNAISESICSTWKSTINGVHLTELTQYNSHCECHKSFLLNFCGAEDEANKEILTWSLSANLKIFQKRFQLIWI